MNRRAFVAGLGAVLAAPLAGEAQQAEVPPPSRRNDLLPLHAEVAHDRGGAAGGIATPTGDIVMARRS